MMLIPEVDAQYELTLAHRLAQAYSRCDELFARFESLSRQGKNVTGALHEYRSAVKAADAMADELFA
jgi:hypothetical protein